MFSSLLPQNPENEALELCYFQRLARNDEVSRAARTLDEPKLKIILPVAFLKLTMSTRVTALALGLYSEPRLNRAK